MRNISFVILLVGCCCDGSVTADGGSGDGGGDAGSSEPDAGDPCFNGVNEGAIGDACNCMRDCGEGLVCLPEDDPLVDGYGVGWPRGTCSRLCTSGSDECGEGAVCPPTTVDENLCRGGCEGDSDCREGWSCLYGYCNPHCVEDSQCLSGHCDPHTDLCSDGAPRDGGSVQALCTRDEDCLSNLCRPAIGGHCLEFCVEGQDDCVEGAICVLGLDSTEPRNGICMIECTTTDECPGQLECLSDGTGRRGCWVRG